MMASRGDRKHNCTIISITIFVSILDNFLLNNNNYNYTSLASYSHMRDNISTSGELFMKVKPKFDHGSWNE